MVQNPLTMTGTDLVVSPLCMGCAMIGSTFDRDASFELLDLFMEKGGNFIDTAHNYADWAYPEKSISEKTIGKWIRSRNNRNKVIIGTKIAQIDLKTMHVRISREEIMSDLEECLQCLQTDYIDLLWLHRDDVNVPVEDILVTLTDLVKVGKVRYFGFSNWGAERLEEAWRLAGESGGFAANQPMWSCALINKKALGDQTVQIMDERMFRFHAETKLTAIPFTSQASGFFTKLAEGNVKGSLMRIYGNDENMKRFERIQKVSQETGLPIHDISLAWIKSQPFPVVPVIGFKNKEQLAQNLHVMELTLPKNIVDFISGDNNLF